MRRQFVLGALVLVGALGAAAGAMQQAPAPTPSAAQLQVDKLRDNLFVVRGAGGNVAVFVTANGVTLVDSKNPGWGTSLLAKVKELTPRPVTTVINTHTHFDHASGQVEFPASVEIVTHENTARYMREANPVYGLQTGPQTNLYTQNNGRGLPKRTFQDRLTIGNGEERVELHYFGRAHTGGDTFVVFPAQRVLHTGDAFPNKGVPIMDINNGGSGVDYAATLDKAAALPNIDTVITGHNQTTLTMADVKQYADFNRDFVEAVRAAKKAGRTIDDVVNTWKVPERFLSAGYTQPMPARLRANVEVVWKETNEGVGGR